MVRNETTLVCGLVENSTAPPVDVPFLYRTRVTCGWLRTFFAGANDDRRVAGRRALDLATSFENQWYSRASQTQTAAPAASTPTSNPPVRRPTLRMSVMRRLDSMTTPTLNQGADSRQAQSFNLGPTSVRRAWSRPETTGYTVAVVLKSGMSSGASPSPASRPTIGPGRGRSGAGGTLPRCGRSRGGRRQQEGGPRRDCPDRSLPEDPPDGAHRAAGDGQPHHQRYPHGRRHHLGHEDVAPCGDRTVADLRAGRDGECEHGERDRHSQAVVRGERRPEQVLDDRVAGRDQAGRIDDRKHCRGK